MLVVEPAEARRHAPYTSPKPPDVSDPRLRKQGHAHQVPLHPLARPIPRARGSQIYACGRHCQSDRTGPHILSIAWSIFLNYSLIHIFRRGKRGVCEERFLGQDRFLAFLKSCYPFHYLHQHRLVLPWQWHYRLFLLQSSFNLTTTESFCCYIALVTVQFHHHESDIGMKCFRQVLFVMFFEEYVIRMWDSLSSKHFSTSSHPFISPHLSHISPHISNGICYQFR